MILAPPLEKSARAEVLASFASHWMPAGGSRLNLYQLNSEGLTTPIAAFGFRDGTAASEPHNVGKLLFFIFGVKVEHG
jgi:hypothetical protein